MFPANTASLRDLISVAINMKRKNKALLEIYQLIRRLALKLGQINERGDESNFEIRFVKTGQVVRLINGAYSYSSR
ncbi:MAG: hypothetical protein QOF22_562 [Bradyrhizobium sp.]|jgi:hypothetical protein|nr:hypothetical protein [Bradyrhizobium sp.]